MDRKLILKIAVLAIIAVFVLQMIAMPFLQGMRESSNGNSKTTNNEIYVVQGITNATIASYSSSISISGNISELKDIKTQLKENDWFDSETYISNTETIFNLKSSLYTKNVSDLLIENGYSVITGVNLKFPDTLGKVKTEELYAVIKTAPIYNIGDQVAIEFAAYAQNDRIIQLAEYELAPQVLDITLDAIVTDVRSTKFDLTSDIEEIQTQIEEEYNVTFENSKVNFEVENPQQDYEFIMGLLNDLSNLKISQSLDVELQPSKEESLYVPMNFIVRSSKLNEINDTLKIKINGLIDKGEIKNIFDYELIE